MTVYAVVKLWRERGHDGIEDCGAEVLGVYSSQDVASAEAETYNTRVNHGDYDVFVVRNELDKALAGGKTTRFVYFARVYLRTGAVLDVTTRLAAVKKYFPEEDSYSGSWVIAGVSEESEEKAIEAAKERGREILAEMESGKRVKIEFGAPVRQY